MSSPVVPAARSPGKRLPAALARRTRRLASPYGGVGPTHRSEVMGEAVRCAGCGEDNREGRKFCGGCGARLVSPCPSCGTSNEPSEKFCGECGTALGVRPALPATSTRKVVTTLFDPEDRRGARSRHAHRDVRGRGARPGARALRGTARRDRRPKSIVVAFSRFGPMRRNAFAGAGEAGGPSLLALWEMPQLATGAVMLRRGHPGKGKRRTTVVRSVRLPEALQAAQPASGDARSTARLDPSSELG